MTTTIQYVVGDATAPTASGQAIIAHVCNDGGGWGRGFVVAISKRWPEPEESYRAWFRDRTSNDFALGAIQCVQVSPTLWVANMVAQHGTKVVLGIPPIRYDALATCLNLLGEVALEHGASVHMPRIGCGLAGGTWDKVEPLIIEALCARGIEVTVYDLAAP